MPDIKKNGGREMRKKFTPKGRAIPEVDKYKQFMAALLNGTIKASRLYDDRDELEFEEPERG